MDLGQSQLYTASVSGGTPPYSYQWYQWLPGGSTPFAGANKTTFDFTPSFAGLNLIYVEITDSLGAKVDIGAKAIVNPPPSISVSPSSGTIDVGQSQAFTSSVSGGTAPYSYQWYLNGSLVSGATLNSWTFTPISMGVYEIHARVTDSLGTSEISNAATMVANPQLTILVSPGSVALDIGESWAFIASVFNGTPPYSSYQWYLDGSPVINATTATWTYTPYSLVSRTIYVTAMDYIGFEGTSNTVLVTVSDAMNPQISPPSSTLDLGQSQEYIIGVSGGAPPYSYQWYQWLPGGSTPFTGATNAAFVFTPPSIGLNIIYVVITDSHGVKVNWGATANVNPDPSVVISPISVTMDISMSQQFASVSVNGTSPYTYQWYLDGSPISGATDNTWTYTSTPSSVGVHEVYLVVTDSVNFEVRSDNATITVNPPLTASISPVHTVTDAGLSVTLTSTIAGGMSPYTYQWYINGSQVSGATKASFNFSSASVGSYAVSLVVTDFFGFTSSSNIATIIVNPHPSVLLSPASAILLLGQNQTFTATAAGGTPSYQYRWYVNRILSAQTTGPTFTFLPSTLSIYYQLYVTIIDIYGLNATSNAAIINGHDVAVTSIVSVDNVGISALKTVYGQGMPMGINVIAANPGYYTETFTITAYANTTVIASHNVTLPGGGIALITLGAIANLAYGRYTISAYALPITNEVNLANNLVANTTTTVTVTLPGDINGDGLVNLKDLGFVTNNWLQNVPPAVANADINGDGAVNLKDLGYVTSHWLQTINL
jgi:hypothetical protein